MNTSIKASSKHAYHTIVNAEFTGVYDRMVFNFTNNPGDNRIGSISGYHLFIRYEDKVYMDVKGVGVVVISFTELQKNRYWKYYYDLSLMLTNDKNLVIQDLKYSSEYLDTQIYNDVRYWSIDTAIIETSMNTKRAKVINNIADSLCYYRINPYDLMYMEYTSQEDLTIFERIYMTRAEIKNNVFDRMSAIYNKIVNDYLMNKEIEEIEKELDDLSIIFEDKKNVFTLSNICYINGLNNDIQMIIYNNIISTEGNSKYETIVSELGKYGRLESDAQILAV